MPFSFHSHSGQFCEGHAKDSLEDVVRCAISQKMQVLALTEHMPRMAEDLYPEEIEPHADPSTLQAFAAKLDVIFASFHAEARRLQAVYWEDITLLVGFEAEWIRPGYQALIEGLLHKYQFDMFVGSVHHVHGIPIDYDRDMYVAAMLAAQAKAPHVECDAEELLFADYFDAQLEMLQTLRPPVVGHFDLIRLKSEGIRQANLKTYSRVWRKVLRNLLFIAEYGGMLEINASALRKGLPAPYPSKAVCKRFLELKGRFVLSDDSHGVDQVGYKYEEVMDFIADVGIEKVSIFEKGRTTTDERFPGIATREVSIESLKRHAFWTSRGTELRKLRQANPR